MLKTTSETIGGAAMPGVLSSKRVRLGIGSVIALFVSYAMGDTINIPQEDLNGIIALIVGLMVSDSIRPVVPPKE